jgi:type I restriction enzyme S subunit
MSLPRYPKYKDSGAEWLGEVPEHWEVKALKHLATLNDDELPESTNPDYEISYVDIGSVSLERGIEKTETMLFSEAPSRARRRVRDGDVIVSTVRTYLKAISPIDEPVDNLIVSTGFAVVRPGKSLSPQFAHFALQSQAFVEDVIARSIGVTGQCQVLCFNQVCSLARRRLDSSVAISIQRSMSVFMTS